MANEQPNGKIELTARSAWTWVFAQLLWWFIATKGLLAVEQFDPNIAKWILAHFTYYNVAVTILTDGWLLLAAYWCSKSKTVPDFWNGVGLCRKPTLTGLFFALAAIGLAFISIIGAMKGLTGGNWVAEVFANRGRATWSFYVIYACSVTPFAEEVAERGFLYRAFRGSYGIPISIALIVCLDIFFHWQIALHSVFTFGCYSAFAILVCVVREKTKSTWNCILCHAVYNAVLLRQWPVCIIAILSFAYFGYRSRLQNHSNS
jgi:membrane protease YdiL (CAAX protease family)